MSDLRSRRTFVRGAGAVAGGALLAGGLPSLRLRADAAETIKVGFISPRSGPLAGFGEGDPYVLELVRKTLGKGLTVGGKTYAVEILDRDTQSDPARASTLAKDLINGSGIDVMLTTSTPETVNPVSDACEAAGVPCGGTIVPWEAWYFGRGAKPGQPSPYKWTYCFSFGVKQFFDQFVPEWHGIETNKKVAVLYPNDADGNAIRAHLIPDLQKASYTVIDPGGYEDGTSDFSAQIARFKAEKCEIFNTFPLPPDFATFWRQATQQGYTKMVKIVQIAKTGLFPSGVESLGSLGDRLLSGFYWHKEFPYKSTLTGVTPHELADGYEHATGKQWQQQLGASMSLFDVGFAALKSSADPKKKADVAKALSTLKTQSMVGKVDFTSGPIPNVSPTILVSTQWIKAKPGSKFAYDNVIVNNVPDPKVPVNAKIVPYNS
ncbi:MAG: ABC transporter substrate-binding protein [Candidatus Eremiobacteraeota bacterium]|nr:ABC transporter substrate-binding protein [Candidatus Eremiobacteraeota bacterium]